MVAPEKIGRYEIKSELGRGGMATVYHGYDPRFEREVAVKVLPSELLHSDPQFKLRFEREAKIIAQLEHPSIVPVYDVGDEGGQPYFVMRYMNGLSLSEKIKSKTISIEEAARILGQIAPGLDEAHNKGIVHRDLKPSNILFDSKGTPYISDFGIAKLSQASGNVTGSGIIGTPAYMAPEQASGETVDGRSDIYAFGIILFEMLTGRQPYEADTPMGVAIKHITDPVPEILIVNPNLPPEVDAIIKTAMAKNKDDRFATAVDMVDALRAVSAGQKPQFRTMTALKNAAPETVIASTKVAGRGGKKGFNVWAVIIPILLIALFGSGYFFYNRADRPVETEAPVVPPVVDTATSGPTSQPTDTSAVVPPVELPTDTPIPGTNTPAAPKLPELGGADKIAFVANNELYLMNVDGSDLKQLTTDAATKSDLQWMPDGETILFISGLDVKFYDISTDTVDTLTSFPAAVSLDSFQVSHDGTQVMIAMSNEVFVVSFDFERMKTIRSRRDLINMEDACIIPKQKEEDPRGYSRLKVKETRWSSDDQLVAWLYQGVAAGNPSLQAEQVSVFDISACSPALIDQIDNFPGTRFDPVGYQSRLMPDFDWDGLNQFTFNTERRNEGWGEFYIYNYRTHKPTLVYPVNNVCCYRDIRWSPDGTFVLFAFQDLSLGAGAKNLLYYVSVGQLTTGANFTPLPLPDGFFKNPKEGPQAALRPAQP
ncbi:MAG TPA: protein kinase [Anaerolineales bacterium]|nr:protein kinase [Anaerolineales bacterium]